MNKEMKLLAKRLTALFLSLVLVIGMNPANIQAEATNEFSFEILDYVDTYYEGFNDNVAVASGTFIELSCDGESNYIQVDAAIAKDDNEGYTEEITINNNDMATAQIVYEDGEVYLKVVYDGEEIYKEVLYTPNYVELSEMPTISLGQEVAVASGTAKYCEQYYRIDESSVSALNKYKVFTLAVEDEDDESDTYIFLYDEAGTVLDENDDSEGEEDDIDSSLTFEMPESGARVVGVRGYDYYELTTATLKLVGGATRVVSFELDNIDSLNVFYEGFNDDLLYATGTRIQATLDNNVVSEWQAEGYYWDDEDDEDGEDDVDILFGDVQAALYRGNDGAVYADYGLSYEDSLTTKKLFTPVIKPVTDIPEITEGTTTINTLEWSGAYSYYRITAEEDEVWTLDFSCTGDPYDYWELYVDVYQQDGTILYYEEQPYNEDTEEVEDLNMEVSVEAGSTIIIGLYDDSDESQEYVMTASKSIDLPPEDGYSPLDDDTTLTIGSWTLYAGLWDGEGNGAISYIGTSDDTLGVKIDSSSGNAGSWAIQVKKANSSLYEGLEVGKTYKLTATFYSTDEGNVLFKLEGFNEGSIYSVVKGTNTIEVEFTYTETPDGYAVYELSGMPAGTYLGQFDFSIEEVKTDVETTTPDESPSEPTSDETTTPEPTTTSVVDPTTAPTTVAPTTTKKVVTPPKKTKVKSASKKKAAKMVKVSIKKVKGANGYRVQFGTTKKFKKILVTKNVKKAKVTIKHKKLKNKKKLYVRVKAYKLNGKKKVLAKKWSKPKAVKIKK